MNECRSECGEIVFLSDAIGVVASDAQTIDGTARAGEGETSWSFTPNEPWPSGDLRIHVDGSLEDVAGNNLRELLDRHTDTPGTQDD